MEKRFIGNNPMDINISDIFSPHRKANLQDHFDSFGEDGSPLVDIIDNTTDKIE